MNFVDKSLANTLKEAACELFLSTLDKVDGAKDLVLSNSILIQLNAVCGMQKLRQNAVDKVFKFDSVPVASETRNRVYVIRPTAEEVRLVARHVEAYLSSDSNDNDHSRQQQQHKHDQIPGKTTAGNNIRFWIIFAPKFLHFCDIILEEEGVHEFVSILECPLGLLPLEYDVYSLEDDTIFKTLFLNKDITPMSVIVNSILQLQLLSGNIFDVHGQGNFARIVADKLDQANLMNGTRPEGYLHISTNNHVKDFENLRFTENKLSDEAPQPAFTDLYLIDRDSDYASLLLSQSNYEGFLDESFSICCNKLEFAATTATTTGGVEGQGRALTKHSLSSDTDPIYRDVRDNHFSTVFSLLRSRNQEIKEKYSRSQEMNLSNLKDFVVNELKHLQAEFKCLGIHIGACEEIMRERNKYDFSDQLRNEQNILEGVEIRKCLDYVQKLVQHQLNPHVPLRLLALLSLTQGGLPPRDYKKYLSLYCEIYGLQNHATFDNLRKLGLITEMNLSLQAITGGALSYGSSSASSGSTTTPSARPIPSSLSLASFTGAMSSFTEKASGRMAAVVSSTVLPRRGNLSFMLKKFQLMPEISDAGYNIRAPKDPAFVFNGAYIPLICQLIDNCVLGPSAVQAKKGAQSSAVNMSPAELMKLLPGPNFKRRQAFIGPNPRQLPANSSSSSLKSTTAGQQQPQPQLQQPERSILIYFIGGVTFAEITALRFLARQRNVKIAIATTSIVNGNKLMSSLCPYQQQQQQQFNQSPVRRSASVGAANTTTTSTSITTK